MISTALELTYKQKVGILYAIPLVLILIAIIIYIVKNRGSSKALSADDKLRNWLEANNFTISTFVNNVMIDENTRRWAIYKLDSDESQIYSFSDISKVELDENGNKYVSQNGVMRAVVGSTILGGVGAVVGATTADRSHTVNSLNVIVYTPNISTPVITIPFITSPMPDSSRAYQSAKADAIKLAGALNAIAMQNAPAKPDAPAAVASAADELAKYKKLLDEGAISEEEYASVKRRLLNL